MKVVLATGVPQLDTEIQQRITDVSFVGNALYKEAVVDVCERKQPDVIILSELLDGVTSNRELILKLRTRFPDTRIIYIMKEENLREKSFLYKWAVFDILPSKFLAKDLEDSLFKPKQFKDVAREMEELKIYEKPEDLIDSESDDHDYSSIKGRDYERVLNTGTEGNEPIYQQIVPFWSVRDQAGKTFSVVNTALMLATNKDLKVLLLDFNTENPNVHLHFRVSDADRNLAALCEDLANGFELNKHTLDDYLITHPVYKNLKILPGYILKMKLLDPETLFSAFEKILVAAQASNFSTILVDTNSGLEDPLTVNILKKSTKIILHVSEDPGSLNAIRRVFDSEVGPFTANLIDKRRVVPVITKSEDEQRVNFKKALERTLELRVGAIIEKTPEIITSLYKGEPILSKKPSERMYNAFIYMSNIVHKNIFRKPVERGGKVSGKPQKGDKKKSGSLFGSLFSKKK